MGTTLKALEKFNIDIFKLANGVHDYQFEIDNSFFESFSESLIQKGKGIVDVSLTKSETLIDVIFSIAIEVELECDRSLELFDFPIKEERHLIYKFGEEQEEIDDEIVIIPRGQQRLNVAQPIYEFIGLAVPMKKVHPDYQDEENEQDELIYTSDETENKEEQKEEEIDPRWKALRKLK